MTENRIVPLRQEGAVDDPLTEILRAGAKRLIARAVEAELDAFPAPMGTWRFPTGANAWCATGMIRPGTSSRGSARSR